ncbi:hypothetical protein D3C81_1910830 [compost metagenome]
MGLFAKQCGLHLVEFCRVSLGRGEDLAKIVVDRRHVVDQQNAAVRELTHAFSVTVISGICKVNNAPRPGPSLWAVRWPFISMAASAQLCGPKP